MKGRSGCNKSGGGGLTGKKPLRSTRKERKVYLKASEFEGLPKGRLSQGEDLEAFAGEPIVDIGDYGSFVSTVAGARASALITPRVPRSIGSVVSRLKIHFDAIDNAKKEEFIDMIAQAFSFDLTQEQADQQEKAWNDVIRLGEIGGIIGDLDRLLGSKLNEKQQVDFVAEGITQMITDVDRIQRFLEGVLWKPEVTSIDTLVLGIQTMHMCKLCLAQALRRIERKRQIDSTVQRHMLYVVVALARFDHYRRGKSTSVIVDFDLYWLYRSVTKDNLSELDLIVRENL